MATANEAALKLSYALSELRDYIADPGGRLLERRERALCRVRILFLEAMQRQLLARDLPEGHPDRIMAFQMAERKLIEAHKTMLGDNITEEEAFVTLPKI